MRRDATLSGVALFVALAFAGCTSLSGQHAPAPAPVVNPQATAAALLASYLELLQRLVTGPPPNRPRSVASARHDFDTAPTPSHQLNWR